MRLRKNVSEKLFLRGFQRIAFLLCLWDEIGPSWKHFPDGAHLGGYVLDAVDNFKILITKNDIAVFSHDFYNQLFVAEIPKLIEMFDFKMDDAFHARLADLSYPAVCDMLSQQHAEIGRSHRAWLILLCQVN